MPDMLVNLMRLPPLEPSLEEVKGAGLVIRRAQRGKLRLFLLTGDADQRRMGEADDQGRRQQPDP